MRTVVERVVAVRSRSRRLRRVRADRALAVFVCLAALPFAGLAGRLAAGTPAMPSASAGGLFGASSLLGPSAGGYVIVAIVSFAAAALLTVCIMARRGSARKDEDDAPKKGAKG